MHTLKKISKESIPEALEKAERYRFLKEPRLAESICLDILEADPGNKTALTVMLLAVTDQFDEASPPDVNHAKQILGKLPEGYERNYYAGIICERQGKAALAKGNPDSSHLAYEWLTDAMEFYEKAETLRPAGNDDSILRWNTCARLIEKYHLQPRSERDVDLQLE